MGFACIVDCLQSKSGILMLVITGMAALIVVGRNVMALPALDSAVTPVFAAMLDADSHL